jgi:hypothetical protein
MKKRAMAATYTAISLEDMEKFLKRAFRVLKPKKGAQKGELVFDLYLSPKTGIRVWTSIAQDGTTGAGVGDDAIRVQLYSFARGRPLMPGKAPIVKRTQGWRDSLKDRIEAYIEAFDSKEDEIEAGKFINWNE